MKTKLKAIDFFCSGGGMTCGLQLAGIDVIAGVDFDKGVEKTYTSNNKAKFLCKDIKDFESKELAEFVKIQRNDDSMIFVGCSPCQYWSIIQTDKEKSSSSKNLLREFQRFVEFYRPGFVVVENVPGIAKKAQESGLDSFIEELEKIGYVVNSDIYNLSEYGIPQTRVRFSLIASRVTVDKIEPEKAEHIVTVRDVLGVDNGFPNIDVGHRDSSDFQHTVASLSKENLEVISKTPKNGGNSVKIRKKFRGKGFGDSYSRMSWDKPAPTLTTRFVSVSNGRFAHPEENRAVSIREGATLQTFPKQYVFYSKNMHEIARMIGNAVPPEFAKRIGKAIVESTNER